MNSTHQTHMFINTTQTTVRAKRKKNKQNKKKGGGRSRKNYRNIFRTWKCNLIEKKKKLEKKKEKKSPHRGFEPTTFGLEDERLTARPQDQLSYEPRLQ